MMELSKYGIFVEIVNERSFTRVAESIGYSQSAISQIVKGIEKELGTVLLERGKDGITLTKDGEEYYPFIKAVVVAEASLNQKRKEMQGFDNSTISLCGFTSVSRKFLPSLMHSFKLKYPSVNYIIKQGDHNQIYDFVESGSVDFGFNNTPLTRGYEGKVLYRDDLVAILPIGHHLAKKEEISLADLAKEDFIMVDEGDHNNVLEAFKSASINIEPAYTIYDDYTILAMIRQGLGVSVLAKSVTEGFEQRLIIKPIKERPYREVILFWKNWEIMPMVSKRFVKFILDSLHD